MKVLCYERSEQTHDIQTSGFLSEFAKQLHGLSFTEEQRGEESKVQDHKAVVFVVLKVKFGRDLQCVQGLSTPPRLPLHIHYVWLQLHHLLLQLTHLGLDTHTRVLVFLKRGHARTHIYTETH